MAEDPPVTQRVRQRQQFVQDMLPGDRTSGTGHHVAHMLDGTEVPCGVRILSTYLDQALRRPNPKIGLILPNSPHHGIWRNS